MQTIVHQRSRGVGFGMKDKEDDLELFLDMRKWERARMSSQETGAPTTGTKSFPLGSNGVDEEIKPTKPSTSNKGIYSVPAPPRKTLTDELLNSGNDKTDYNWLVTPPRTPLLSSLAIESQKGARSRTGNKNARPTALKYQLSNSLAEATLRGHALSTSRNSSSSVVSRQQALSTSLNSSSGSIRRSFSSGGPTSTASRPATPSRRSTLPTTARTSRPSTPTSRATHSAPVRSSTPPRPSTPTSRATYLAPARSSTPKRPSTPTSRAACPAVKSTAPARPSTLTSSMARPSTPTSRTSVTGSKATSMLANPIRRPSPTSSRSNPLCQSFPVSNPTHRPSPTSGRSNPLCQSSPVSKSGTSSTLLKSPMASHGSSPTVKSSRRWNPSEMPGFSFEVPPNLRTSLPVRPASASRGRPGASAGRSSSIEAGSNGRPRRQSCSPSRGRASLSKSLNSSGSMVPAINQIRCSGSVSPAAVGNKMVERGMSMMRRLALPKQDDDCASLRNFPSGKSSCPETTPGNNNLGGSGRTPSQKPVDTPLRHMDTRRTIPGNNNLRPVMTKIPASSVYSVRSAPASSRTDSVSSSPLATCSNTNSEVSVNFSNPSWLEGSEVDDDALSSEKGQLSPVVLHGR